VGEGGGADAGAGEADAEHYRHPRGGAGGEARGADGLSAINTINSITGIDLDTFEPRPNVDGKSSHGGYCGPAVKPIALNMIQQVNSDHVDGAADSDERDWRRGQLARRGGVHPDGLRHGAGMHGSDALRLRIVEDMIDGLSDWMDEKGFVTIEDFRGKSLPKVTEWKHLNLNYKIVAQIDEALCIGCQLCHIACWDGAHQCIHLDRVSGRCGRAC
jgi:dihydropyrimidine dehydrogenase (NAD+) subunit PreA